jgi:hypothetical protein
MLKKKLTLQIITFSLLLLFGSGGAPFTAEGQQPQSPKDQEWVQVNTLLEAAKEKRRKERLGEASPDESQKAFEDAALEYRWYIKTYIKDENSVEYLNAIFRLGVTWEAAGNYDEAKGLYELCSEHRMKNSPRATYNGQALAPLIIEYLEVVLKLLVIKKNEERIIEIHTGRPR